MLRLAIAAFAAAALTTAAGAQNTPMSHTMTKTTTPAKPAVMTHTTSKTSTTKPAMMASSSTKMATTTTKSGKKITYDCSKAGNANKAVCKK